MGFANDNNLLIVDDEPNAVKALSTILSSDGYRVFGADSVNHAQNIIRKENLDAVITDLKMPGKDGTELLEFITEHYPNIPVIFMTAYGTVDSAVKALTDGAFYYLIKPLDIDKLRALISRAINKKRLAKELQSGKDSLLHQDENLIIGHSDEVHRILETINAVKNSLSSIVITGETGTGKELIAKTLHFSSSRREKPFIAVNCAAIPTELMESELFGCEKGAFTGAVSSRTGRFEEASGGTFYLDEIGELDIAMQVKLLRVLEEREIERLGSNKKIKVDFRLISSTNRNLEEEVRAGRFREDLLYRINVIEIKVPALRERKGDIPLIVSEFLREYCIRESKSLTICEEVMHMLRKYDWPGNVRQLRNVIERAVVLAKKSVVTEKELPDEILSDVKHKLSNSHVTSMRELENNAVVNALYECDGNKSKAARMLGISRKAFYKRLRDANAPI